jgi:hypothetical protein
MFRAMVSNSFTADDLKFKHRSLSAVEALEIVMHKVRLDG